MHHQPVNQERTLSPVNLDTVLSWWVFPRWVELSRKLHSWWCPSVNSFKFQPCDHTPPRTQWLNGFPSIPRRSIKVSYLNLSWHRLQSGLRRYLIIFDPLTLVPDQWRHDGLDRLRLRSSCENIGISPLDAQYQSPWSLLLSFPCGSWSTMLNYSSSKNYQKAILHAACFKHTNLFTV